MYTLYNVVIKMTFSNVFSVSFFGHRNFSAHFQLEPILEKIIKDLISEHEFVEFLVGRNGEFDSFVSSTIRKVKREFWADNSELTLVLPYSTKEFENNEEYFKEYYDHITIFSPDHYIYHKALVTERNREMVLRSDAVICYVAQHSGGAYNAMIFAQNNKILTLNLYDYIKENALSE